MFLTLSDYMWHLRTTGEMEEEHQSYKISVNDVSPRDMLSVVLKYLNLVVKENMTGLHYARRDICTGLR